MKIFVYEFVTGGGMAEEVLPVSLTREADLMVRALLADLATVPGVELLTSRDARLPVIPGVEMLVPRAGESFLSLYERGLDLADAAWPTAPETGGALLQLVRSTVWRGRLLLGCRPDAVELASSKRATAECLARAGIPVVRTLMSVSDITGQSGRWVIKPDDGAGCEDTILVSDCTAARAALATKATGRFIAQPWLDGDPLSLSLLCHEGEARLLSVNRQRIEVAGGRVRLAALEVNALADDAGRFLSLARQIARAVPSLWGYVGVDLIDTASGPVVLEINPRLTTSYCGLGSALGINVGRLVLNLVQAGLPVASRDLAPGRSVALTMEAGSDG